MSSASNRLVVLATADQLPDDSCDILALTLPAMAKLKAEGRSFFVLEDVFSHPNVYENTNDIADNVTQWLQDCDQLCLQHLDVERAFSSTGFWILHRLSDLNYIHQIINVLDSRYQHIECWTTSSVPCPPSPKVDFSSLNMPSFGIGLIHVLWFMQAGLPTLVMRSVNSSMTDEQSPQVGGEPWWSLLKRLPGILGRRLGYLKTKLTSTLYSKIGHVWVVQSGYDVDVLAHARPEWNFANIRHYEADMANKSSAESVEQLDKQIVDIAQAFFAQHFPRYQDWLLDWFQQYYQQVVLKLKNYEEALGARMAASNPKALLYSIGAEDALEEVLCRVANRLSIPVFFFKHGGIAEHFLLPSILDPYLEQNTALQRTQFIHSEIEKTAYGASSPVKTIVSGPLSRVKPLKKGSTRNKKILYSVGPPAHYSFKELRKMISDYERFNFINDLLEICNDQKLDLSLKVHPAEWPVAWECLRIINQAVDDTQNKAHFIAGGSIERIFNQFGLLVLDMISTRVLSMAIGLDIPIVLYVPADNPVNTKYFPDLENRVYVVRSRRELADILSVYQREGLPSKYDRAFVEKYLGCFDPESAIQIVSDHVFNRKREEVC